ncbi:MAG: tRNA (N6-isopentenyl adenosine(37)-C2)-methylthiotransferase MiaB [Parachlamydiales bacterium]|nr:tRNA (N6-isopentenyl adenosine(37)-C2)-methylthiotransferase MiaB [Parachlamydiales bacterium]
MTTTLRKLNTYYIRTYGCQMNELDTEIMVGQLKARGLQACDDETKADLLIFNTCSIRDLAERKVMGKLGQLGNLGRIKNRRAVIGITGCMANAKKEGLFRKLPHVDFVLGTNNIGDLNHVLDEVVQTGRQLVMTDDEFSENLNYLQTHREDKVKAFVSIIRGCDKHCTYCVVPYTRGPEVSRPPESIIEECRHLVSQGYKEITLLGQNVNSYGKDKPEWTCLFHDLLYKLDQIPGLERVRYMTSHPIDISRELMEATRDLRTLCEFVHFPIQSGSDRILRKMHRIYKKEQYLEKVAMLKEIVPNVALGTDMIVGFPTETDEEFEETYKVMEDIEYAFAFLFAYSPRKGTPSMRWKDDIPEDVKNQRLQRLIGLQNEITAKQLADMLGQEVEVLVEKLNRSDRGHNILKSRTRCWRKVIFPGEPSMIGTLQRVKIHSFSNQTLIGELVQKNSLVLQH